MKAFSAYKDRKVIRNQRGENQHLFWSRIGVTQSGGSRYEAGRDIPLPTAMLLQLFLDGTITGEQLLAVKKKLTRKT